MTFLRIPLTLRLKIKVMHRVSQLSQLLRWKTIRREWISDKSGSFEIPILQVTKHCWRPNKGINDHWPAHPRRKTCRESTGRDQKTWKKKVSLSIYTFIHTRLSGIQLMLQGSIMLTLWTWRSCRVWAASSSLLSAERAPRHWDADENHPNMISNILNPVDQYFAEQFQSPNLICLPLQVFSVTPVSP